MLRTALVSFAVLFVGIIFQACIAGESSKGCWKNLGLQLSEPDSVMLPEAVHSQDSLTIVLSASIQGSGKGEFSHIDIQRAEHQIEVTIWCNEYQWQCESTMPPTSLAVLIEHAVMIPPPFEPGDLELIVVDPSGQDYVDTLIVQP